MNKPLLKPFLPPPGVIQPTERSQLLRQPMHPLKHRVLTEVGGLVDKSRVLDARSEFLELHPSIAEAIREKSLRISVTTQDNAGELIDSFIGEMKNAHLKRPNQKGEHPCDFTEMCLVGGLVGQSNSREEIQDLTGHFRTKVMPNGLIVASHFSVEEDLVFVAVRRMFGQDGQHLSGSQRSSYENFFASSAW